MQFNYEIFSTEDAALEAKGFLLLPDGIYDFTIVKAVSKISKSGNEMIELKHKIVHEGKEYFVFGYLIGTKNMSWLIKHFCEATSLEHEYLNGLFNEQLANNKMGKVLIKKEPGKPKNDGSGANWAPKNVIEDYIKPSDTDYINYCKSKIKDPKKKALETPDIVDDEIPF